MLANLMDKVKRFLSTMAGRMLLIALGVLLLATSLVGLSLSYAFRSYALQDIDARLSLSLDAMVGGSEIGPDGVLRFTRPLFDQRYGQPYSGWYWQISEVGQPAFRSRSLWDFELSADLERSVFDIYIHEVTGPDDQRLRVVERDIILPEADRVMRYMVAADTSEVRAAINRFDGLIILLLGAIALAIFVMLLVQLGVGLAPLRRIVRQLGDVRAGTRERMAGDYPADIQPLASEIDALIDHNAQLVDRARTHVGNLAHGLKTPLSVIKNEIARLPDETAGRISVQLNGIISQVDHHLRRARATGSAHGPTVNVAERVGKIASAIERLHKGKMLDVSVHIASSLTFRGETQDFDEIVGNLLENAGKWARRNIAVSAVPLVVDAGHRAAFELRVEDDGPGVAEADRAVMFERGKRLDESVPGTGLGLSIVIDTASLYGGEAAADRSEALGGLMVRVRLPMGSANTL